MDAVEVLNMLKSGIYVYGYVDAEERKIDVSEGEVLLQSNIRLCKAAKVTIKPLFDVKLPIDFQEAKWLIEKVGKPPSVRLFQYKFLLQPLQLIRKLGTGAELYRIGDQPTGMILANVAHLFYSVYISRRGRVYGEKGGVKAYSLLKKGEIRWPQVYVWRGGYHHVEIGLRIPLDADKIHQLFSHLLSC